MENKSFERANLFSVCASVNEKDHYEGSRVTGDLN